MNTLTSVGGQVVESEELNSMHDRLSRTGTTSPKNNSSSSGRLNSPRGQINREPMRRSASPGNDSPVAKAKRSLQIDAPSAVINNDEGNKTITIPIRPPDLHLPPRSPKFKTKLSSPISSKQNNYHIINLLETLSQQESFRASSYFRGVFARGIDKVKQQTRKFATIEEALELCFDVSDDMRKVIASKVQADEMMAKMMNPPDVVKSKPDWRSSSSSNIRSKSNKPRPWETPLSNIKKVRPWETDGAKSNYRRPNVQEYMEQIEDRIHITYTGSKKTKPKPENKDKLSVFRANAALEVAAENERKSRSPFDEALVSPRLVRRKGEDYEVGMSKEYVFPASERLVKELELIDDRARMTLELEKHRHDLNRQREESEKVKDALEEAEIAVQTLEETVRELNKATKEKDEIIGRLEGKVKEEEIASAGSQKAHQEQVKELGTAVAQLNTLVKKMEDEKKEVDASLKEAEEKYNKSEATLKMLQLTMTKKDNEQTTLIEKLEGERDDLVKELEACKETMATSLDNTTKQMDGIIKEKDKLIYSLNEKIEILESNAEDMKERKLEADVLTANKEKELNEKIHDLATTLIEKNDKMTALEKEIEELKASAKKAKKRSGRHERRHHSKRRPWEEQDIDSLRSSFESREERERSRRPHRKSSHRRRRSYGDGTREAVPERVGYSTPEPYYEDEHRDDRYGYPERDGALFSPVDDDSYVYRRHM